MGIRVSDAHLPSESLLDICFALSCLCCLVPSLDVTNVRVRKAREETFEVLNLTVGWFLLSLGRAAARWERVTALPGSDANMANN